MPITTDRTAMSSDSSKPAGPVQGHSDAGFTVVELLVAAAMSVVLVGAASMILVSAMKSQPEASKEANDISSARWVLERLTREIRNGVKVDNATASEVSFQTYLRRTTCGGTTPLAGTSPSIQCEVTYTCTTTSCSRTETAPGTLTGGTPQIIFDGIDNGSVFSYTPNTAAPTYIGVTLHLPDPSGGGGLTVSDGASLRNATLPN
jgi:type II secretory pathway pseudopilin PulG